MIPAEEEDRPAALEMRLELEQQLANDLGRLPAFHPVGEDIAGDKQQFNVVLVAERQDFVQHPRLVGTPRIPVPGGAEMPVRSMQDLHGCLQDGIRPEFVMTLVHDRCATEGDAIRAHPLLLSLAVSRSRTGFVIYQPPHGYV